MAVVCCKQVQGTQRHTKQLVPETHDPAVKLLGIPWQLAAFPRRSKARTVQIKQHGFVIHGEPVVMLIVSPKLLRLQYYEATAAKGLRA